MSTVPTPGSLPYLPALPVCGRPSTTRIDASRGAGVELATDACDTHAQPMLDAMAVVGYTTVTALAGDAVCEATAGSAPHPRWCDAQLRILCAAEAEHRSRPLSANEAGAEHDEDVLIDVWLWQLMHRGELLPVRIRLAIAYDSTARPYMLTIGQARMLRRDLGRLVAAAERTR